VSSGYLDLLADLFAPLGGVRFRRMFGGHGIYRDGVMFALVSDDVLYMKADAETARRYEAESCGRFVYEAKGKPVAMSYWRLPERLYDEPDEFVAWAREAVGVAKRSRAASGKRRRECGPR
jgi:DNA transformation protein